MNKKYFDEAFDITIGHEKGYVFDPDDKGGETNYGISKRSYPDIDIKNLSLKEAKIIYFVDFWNTRKGHLSNLPKSIAIEVFDTGVNMGINRARMMLQTALNLLNRVETLYDDLTVDGWIGDTTLEVIKKVSERKLLKVLNGLQFKEYFEIVEDYHSQEKFFAGWVERT
jgi:lysozyme family protein